MAATLLWVGLATPALGQAQPAPAVQPKIVLQTMAATGIDAAAWTPDGRFIVTASGIARELLVWDAGERVIIDRLRLPAAPGATLEFMQVQAITVAGDKARLEALVLDPADPQMMTGRAYVVDLQRRQVTTVPAAPVPPTQAADRMLPWLAALEAVYRSGTGMTAAQAAAKLPKLPASPDGRSRLVRGGTAFAVIGADGRTRPLASDERSIGLDDAGLSPDGRRLAMIEATAEPNARGQLETPLAFFDLLTGQFGAAALLPGDYDDLFWLDAGHVIAVDTSDDDPADPDTGVGELLPILVVDAASATVARRIPGRCLVRVLPDGGLVGAGLANCRRKAGTDFGLQRFDPTTARWQPLPVELAKGTRVTLLAASPRGDRIAVALLLPDTSVEIAIMALADGETGPGLTLPAGTQMTRLAFSADGRTLYIAGNGEVLAWPVDSPEPGSPTTTAIKAFVPSMLVSDARTLLVGGGLEESIKRAGVADGAALPPLAMSNVMAGGFVPGKPLFWAAGLLGELKLWDTRNWRLLMTTSFFGNRRFLSVAADGRYDTNLGPDAAQFRWFMADEPWRSLAPQSFMRDYFEPRLIQKLTDCTVAGNCRAAMRPLPPMAGLNRVLPRVRITGVKAAAPGTAIVSIEAAETSNPAAANGITRSGVYGYKLFINNRQVAQQPETSLEPRGQTLAQWRQANASDAADADGVRRWEHRVQVPTDGLPLQFSAYSFNSDRVKSDTARLTWTPPPGPPRPRRAFVVTIGVDNYAESRLALNFAVSDAGVIADRLAVIPGHEMRRVSLTTRRLADGRAIRVSRDDIEAALGILAGLPAAPRRARLAAAGHDADALDSSTPDDIVILSFSGHGFADAAGNFALLASDARWPAAALAPDAATAITAADLTTWLRAIAAADIAFVIDACHSGASVQTPDFKPGPMGDPGLGQLAFDKGLRILAATQADDVALESASLRQGLLTAALGEGLTPVGGPADTNRDGKVLLDEWLRYAVARLPSLNEEARRGGGPMAARGVRLVMRAPTAAPRVQEPSLFDFNAAPSAVTLRGRP